MESTSINGGVGEAPDKEDLKNSQHSEEEANFETTAFANKDLKDSIIHKQGRNKMMNISGQIDSKEQEGIERFQSDVSEMVADGTPATVMMDKSKSIVVGESDGEFDNLKMTKSKSVDESGYKRKDRNGNPITTEIGRFSLSNVSRKSAKRKTVVGAGTGGKEEEAQIE